MSYSKNAMQRGIVFLRRHSSFSELAGLLQGPLKRLHLLEIHARVFRIGAHQDDLLATRLIGRYPPHLASVLLRLLVRPGIFPFNAALRVLADSGDSAAAAGFSVFNSLRLRSPIAPNGFTFSFLLKACSRSPLQIRQVHPQIFKFGLEEDPTLGNALLSSYTKGDLEAAQKLFDEMSERTALSISSWSSLIRGLSREDKPEEALRLFLRMRDQGLSPEDETMVAVLSACSKIQEIENWVDLLCSRQRPEDDSIDTVLVYLYAKSGELKKSRAIFDVVIERSRTRNMKTSILLWNCMISGHPTEALTLFRLLASSPLHPKPNHVTIAAVLSPCAELGDLELGRSLHKFMVKEGQKRVLQSNSILATTFIDMYCKCGSLDEAMRVFEELEEKDVVAFNAMIGGLAVNGKGMEALELFKEMGKLNLSPNGGTFVAALSACSHAGLVDEGQRLFEEMLRPGPEHYACYVDLLARAGRVGEAAEAYKAAARVAAGDSNEQAWGALFGACLVNSGEELAREMAAMAPEIAGGYIMASNAAAAGGQWTEVEGTRKAMLERGLKKQPGRSWITVNGATRQFQIGCLAATNGVEDQLIPRILESLHAEMTELLV